MMVRALLVALLAAPLIGCIDKDMAQKAIQAVQADGVKPDEMPVMRNREPPFRFPTSLYDKQVQGNVTLRIHIDTAGFIVPDSTQLLESSGHAALDSAAVTGSQALHFTPAKLAGKAIPVSVLLPVFFRHPKMPPLPGDSVLRNLPKGGDKDGGRPRTP